MYFVQQLFHKIPTKHIIKHLKSSIVSSCVILIQVAVVSNNQSINELPKIEGQLSYRSDDRKLYLNEKSQWRALATQEDVSYMVCTRKISIQWTFNFFSLVYNKLSGQRHSYTICAQPAFYMDIKFA